PTGPELELTAAVHADPAGLAGVDYVEELLHTPEARRLDVQPARLERQSLEIRQRVDRRVEGEPVVGVERLAAAVREPGVLEHRLRKRGRDEPVTLRLLPEVREVA